MKLIKFKCNFSYDAPALILLKVVTDDEWDIVNRAILERIDLYLGEIAGKHSEVIINMGKINTCTDFVLSVVSEDDKIIENFTQIVGCNYFGNFDLVGRIYDHFEEND